MGSKEDRDGAIADFDEQVSRWADFYEEYFDDPIAVRSNDKDNELLSKSTGTDDDFDPVPWNTVEYSPPRMKAFETTAANVIPIDIFKTAPASIKRVK